jgi:multiple sugar transport system permease protein
LTRGRLPLLAVAAGLLLLLLPFAWMLSVSVGGPDDVYAQPYRWFKTPWELDNYTGSLAAAPFGRYYLNTLFVSTGITLGVLVTSSLTGFGLAKYRFRGRRVVFALVVATLMVPFQTLLIPLFLIVKNLGWLDTYKALIVPFTVQGFGIFFMRQYIISIPDSLLDAARLDGVSEWRLYRDIIVPLSKPALAALGVFTFVSSWNLFLWPLVTSSTPDHWTVQVGIADFYQRFAPKPHLLMASAALAMIPMIILFLTLRRFLTTGLPTWGGR